MHDTTYVCSIHDHMAFYVLTVGLNTETVVWYDKRRLNTGEQHENCTMRNVGFINNDVSYNLEQYDVLTDVFE